MSQVLTIQNPTGGNVAYMSRDCRITVPTGESTHDVSEEAAKRITAFLQKHHPLLKVSQKAVASASEPEAIEADAPKAPAKSKPASRRKASPKADASTENEASAE